MSRTNTTSEACNTGQCLQIGLTGDPDFARPGSAPLVVRLRLPDGAREFPVKPTQRVERGGVVLFSGETLCVEGSSQADAAGGVVLVPTVADWKKTIVLRLWKMAGQVDMLLVVSNPFPKSLKYRAIMAVPFEERSRYASSCAVGPERVVFEHWLHPIVSPSPTFA
jgi:hypothetical protein